MRDLFTEEGVWRQESLARADRVESSNLSAVKEHNELLTKCIEACQSQGGTSGTSSNLKEVSEPPSRNSLLLSVIILLTALVSIMSLSLL